MRGGDGPRAHTVTPVSPQLPQPPLGRDPCSQSQALIESEVRRCVAKMQKAEGMAHRAPVIPMSRTPARGGDTGSEASVLYDSYYLRQSICIDSGISTLYHEQDIRVWRIE